MRHGSRRTYQRRKQRRMQQRGAPRSSVSVGPGSAGATGSHRDRRRCARGGCSRPGAQAVAHAWGPGGSWQAQSGAVMAARCHQSFKAAALPGRFTRRLAGREHVEELCTERSCAAPRTRSSLGRVTLLRARYRARQQGARSRHRSAACQARTGGAPSARPRRPRRRRTAPHPHRRLRWARKMPQNRGAIGAAAPPRPASRRLKRSDVV